MLSPIFADVHPAAAAIIRRAAAQVQTTTDEWSADFAAATVGPDEDRAWAQDPELRRWVTRAGMSNLTHWVSSNLDRPGELVGANLSDDVIDTARNVVRRGFDETILDSYRTGQNFAWQQWMRVVFSVADDLDSAADALERTAITIAAFVDGTIAAVADRIRQERSSLLVGAQADRRAIAGLLVAGEPVQAARAEQVLAYPLRDRHVAAVVWDTSASVEVEALTRVARAVFQGYGAVDELVVHASTATLWLWMTVPDPAPALPDLRAVLRLFPGVDVATGTVQSGMDGFRATHLEAVAAQRYAAATGARFVDYDDCRLAMLLDAVPDGIDEFVRAILGDFANASSEVRETTRVFVREQCSIARTAARLHVHRNTVIRRLERAERTLPVALATRSVEIAVALEALRRRV